MKRALSKARIVHFRRDVYDYYKRKGRVFPWRDIDDPYHVLISEVMLQQTQVDRVIPKYREFIKRYPSARSLARAPLRDVLKVWQGLGYNRRARFLHKAAQEITKNHQGRFPNDTRSLVLLPGVGPYTAAAVVAFAFNKPTVMIETNIRTVFLHSFFKQASDVHDDEITPLIDQTMDRRNPRRWYSALMDYGAMIKKDYGNQNARSKHYVRQKAFHGSKREARGVIVRLLTLRDMSAQELLLEARLDARTIREAIRELKEERMIIEKNAVLCIKDS